MKNKRTFPLLMLIWVSFLFSANAFSVPDLIVEMVVAGENVERLERQAGVQIDNRSFQLVAKVTNTGTATSESTEVQFYYSTDEKVFQKGKMLSSRQVPQLLPNEYKTYDIDTTAPRSIGEHYYDVYVVPVKDERDAGNNWNEWSTRSVSIWVYGGKRLKPPPADFISDVAFTENATYFVLNAQFLNLMNENLEYSACGITPHILQGPNAFQPVPPGDTTDSRRHKPGYYMFQLQSLNDQREALVTEEERIENIKNPRFWSIRNLITTGFTFVGSIVGGKAGAALGSLIPGGGTAAGAAAGFVVGGKITGAVGGFLVAIFWNNKDLKNLEDEKVQEILSSTANPTLLLIPEEVSRTTPKVRTQFLFLIPKEVEFLPITIKQTFRNNGKTTWPAKLVVDGNLGKTASAAPHAQPMSLTDYPPFQRLSPEVQAYLLQQFGESANSETWQLPETTSLLPNYPNPFNPETWIPYQLSEPADVALTIYDIHGHVIRELDLGHQRAGMYHSRSRAAYWEGRNSQGEPVASGIYFYTLKAGDFTATRKMLIRK